MSVIGKDIGELHLLRLYLIFLPDELTYKRTLCLSHLTGSLSRLVSSITGVKCWCSLFNQCLILGLYFNKGMKWQFKCPCRYIFDPFPGICYVNLSNVELIFNPYKSPREMCFHLLKDSRAVLICQTPKAGLCLPQ